MVYSLDKDCIFIFMISAAEFGLSVMAFIWTVLDILLVCNFWEVEFTAVIMPIFFFGLTKPNIFDVIFGKYFWIILCRIMSTSSSQCRVQ
jgi:hypothetical protein